MSQPVKSLYERFKESGIAMDSWQSDLYVKVTEETTKIIREFKEEGGIVSESKFRSPNGTPCYDLPFQFDPYWDKKARHESNMEQEPIEDSLKDSVAFSM